jgi:hypothetical protein
VTVPTLNRQLIAVMFLRSFKRNERVTEFIEFSNHAPNIEGLTDRGVAVGREQGAGDGVVDVGEAACLVES